MLPYDQVWPFPMNWWQMEAHANKIGLMVKWCTNVMYKYIRYWWIIIGFIAQIIFGWWIFGVCVWFLLHAVQSRFPFHSHQCVLWWWFISFRHIYFIIRVCGFVSVFISRVDGGHNRWCVYKYANCLRNGINEPFIRMCRDFIKNDW